MLFGGLSWQARASCEDSIDGLRAAQPCGQRHNARVAQKGQMARVTHCRWLTRIWKWISRPRPRGWISLSRQIVLEHGGDMWTEPAHGARFVICLPLSSVLTAAFNGTL